MKDSLLITVAVLSIAIVVIMWIQNYVFRKPLRRMLMTLIAIALNRDTIVDPNAPIKPLQEEPLSDILEERAAQLKFDHVAQETPVAERAKSVVPPNERGDKARDTSDSGWPRTLDDRTRRSERPFRQVHLSTENEQTHEIMDVDTYEENLQNHDQEIKKQDKEQEDL